MTLSTNIYVIDELAPHELFRNCQTLLTKYDDRQPPQPWNEQACSDTRRKEWRDGEWRNDQDSAWVIRNKVGQGLPATLKISYRPGEPLRTAEQAAAHDEDCDEDCSVEYHKRACWLDIDFDTAYGYRDSRGWGCGDLHAVLIAEVGQWLDERGVRWEWRNEFTGEIHSDLDRYARTIDLCSGGADAAAWLRGTVLPAILSGVDSA